MSLKTAKERLVRYYEHYNPTQLHRVDEILEAFHYDTDLLFFELTQKYGPEPRDVTHKDAGDEADEDEAVNADERPGWQTIIKEVPPADAHSAAVEDVGAEKGIPDDSVAYASPLEADLDPGDASSPLVSRAPLGTTVYGGAFSPTRRRLPERIGALFSDGGSARLGDALVRQSAAQQAIKKSDELVAMATAVVYRKDPGDISREVARALLDSAKTRSSLSALATSTVSNIHRSVASDVYAAKIRELSPTRQSTLQQQQQEATSESSAAGTSASHSMLQRAAHVVVPPVRAMQTTLNVDEMSSYQALARAQLAGAPALEHPVLHASKPVGGLYLTNQQQKSMAEANAERYHSFGARRSWEASATKRQHRRLFASPLVAKLRAQGGAIAQSDSGDEGDDPSRSGGADGPVDGAADDGAIPMICIGCGLVCSVVPGREHEAAHSHPT